MHAQTRNGRNALARGDAAITIAITTITTTTTTITNYIITTITTTSSTTTTTTITIISNNTIACNSEDAAGSAEYALAKAPLGAFYTCMYIYIYIYIHA